MTIATDLFVVSIGAAILAGAMFAAALRRTVTPADLLGVEEALREATMAIKEIRLSNQNHQSVNFPDALAIHYDAKTGRGLIRSLRLGLSNGTVLFDDDAYYRAQAGLETPTPDKK